MLGLQDRFHAFVVLQRVRDRCRSRVTDVVVHETPRIEEEIKRVRIVLDQKKRMRPTLCCGLRLRVMAYTIFFTVLSRSPRTASSKVLAVAAQPAAVSNEGWAEVDIVKHFEVTS